MTKEPWARGGSLDRCVCPRLLYTQPPSAPLLPIHRLWPPLGVVIQISKSVCFHPPFPQTSFSSTFSPPPPPHPHPLPSPLYVHSTFAASTSSPVAGYLSHQLPSFHGNLGAGLCILYSVCDKPTRYVCSCRCRPPTPSVRSCQCVYERLYVCV